MLARLPTTSPAIRFSSGVRGHHHRHGGEDGAGESKRVSAQQADGEDVAHPLHGHVDDEGGQRGHGQKTDQRHGLTRPLSGEQIFPTAYRPAINVRFSNNISGQPVAGQPFFTFIDSATRESPFRHLPLILHVGNPQPPRLLFALLMNEILQAQRGVVAIEDRARFGIAPHIAVVADRLVLPHGRRC